MTTERSEPTTADLARAAATDQTDAEPQPDLRREPSDDEVGPDHDTDELQPLLGAGDGDDLRDRWHRLQSEFVDDPRRTVAEADQLVAEVMGRLAQMFADERQGLEDQWSEGQQASTEDLRVALQRYRSFFERLLAA
jgi:hypothetical protein